MVIYFIQVKDLHISSFILFRSKTDTRKLVSLQNTIWHFFSKFCNPPAKRFDRNAWRRFLCLSLCLQYKFWETFFFKLQNGKIRHGKIVVYLGNDFINPQRERIDMTFPINGVSTFSYHVFCATKLWIFANVKLWTEVVMLSSEASNELFSFLTRIKCIKFKPTKFVWTQETCSEFVI